MARNSSKYSVDFLQNESWPSQAIRMISTFSWLESTSRPWGHWVMKLSGIINVNIPLEFTLEGLDPMLPTNFQQKTQLTSAPSCSTPLFSPPLLYSHPSRRARVVLQVPRHEALAWQASTLICGRQWWYVDVVGFSIWNSKIENYRMLLDLQPSTLEFA